jgi:hypothetical protein
MKRKRKKRRKKEKNPRCKFQVPNENKKERGIKIKERPLLASYLG